MKKMLLKLSSALLVVVVAGSCAFAQGQSNAYKPNKASAEKSIETKTEVQNADREIYRAVDSSAKSTTKSGEVVDRPIVTKRSTSTVQTSKVLSRTEVLEQKEAAAKAAPKATRIDVEAAKAKPAPVSKVRVNNTVNALPADYKANETRTSKSED